MESFPPPRPFSVLVGHVRDPRGRPVAGAEVFAVPPNGAATGHAQTVTQFDGWFSLGPLARDLEYRICVSPIAGAGWTVIVPLHVPADGPPAEMTIVVEPGRTVVLRMRNLPVGEGDVTLRLLRGDGSVAAESFHEGLLVPDYDIGVFGDRWGFHGVFRDLEPGEYRLEAATTRAPIPGTPGAVTVSATEPTILDIDPVAAANPRAARGAARRGIRNSGPSTHLELKEEFDE